MATTKFRRAKYSSRPFFATILLMTLLATYALFLKTPQLDSNAQDSPLGGSLGARLNIDDCENVHHAKDQCAFVRANCLDDEAGLLYYLELYYCVPHQAKPIAFAIITCWLALLFLTIGIAASDFFSVNLSTISTSLGLSESVAGVTFLALGNGSPDVFSTFAAMNSNSGSMAVGELIGAAGFITAVVAGSMALVREFKVTKKTFVRDIVFFIIAVSFTMIFLCDGEMYLYECIAMIAFYAFYVIFVVSWHWFSTRRRNRRNKENAARSLFAGASGHTGEEIEPYRDDDGEGGDGTVGGRRASGNSVPDISALERGPRFDLNAQDDDDEDKKMHIASEMTSSMRVNRPRGRSRTTTITPIRPSLVGALEFRSVLSSLQKARNMRLAPLNRAHSDYHPAGLLARSTTDLDALGAYQDNPTPAQHSAYRERARSSGAVPRFHSGGQPPPLITTDSAEDSASAVQQGRVRDVSRHGRSRSVAQRAIARSERSERAPSPTVAATKDGLLAPPDSHARPSSLAPEPGTRTSPPSLSLDIPSPKMQPASHTSSPTMSPFPRYSESPVIITPHSPGLSQPMLPPPMVEEQARIPGVDSDTSSPRPVRWWPYRVLPPPHIFFGTLFPTLQRWREKSFWGKLVSLITFPSMFLLGITLPVVEIESLDGDDDEVEDSPEPPRSPGMMGELAPHVAVEGHFHIPEPETEWQQYRRQTRSIRSRGSSTSRDMLTPSVHTPYAHHTPGGYGFPDLAVSGPSSTHHGQPLSESGLGGSEPDSDSEPAGWNRWLLALQLFTGPLFTVCIVWVKYMDQPIKVLVKMILYSLVFSLVLLALLLFTTTPDKKPKYHHLFCYMGFIISIAWISTIAEEVVGILKDAGVILGMSEAILGLTIFAVGNSVGDLVADITVARLGYPVMALSACFGGPMLNILLGIGLGGIWQTTKSANHSHKKHPNRPISYKPYHIDVTGTLFVSAITVLVTLIALLIFVPMNKWMMTRKIGIGLITLWSVSTAINVVIEVTGVWKAVA